MVWVIILEVSRTFWQVIVRVLNILEVFYFVFFTVVVMRAIGSRSFEKSFLNISPVDVDTLINSLVDCIIIRLKGLVFLFFSISLFLSLLRSVTFGFVFPSLSKIAD